MARPTEDETLRALEVLDGLVGEALSRGQAGGYTEAYQTLCKALKPRPVWPVKEAADYLGVRQENLRRLKHPDLPEPAYEFPRPSRTDPYRTMRLFWVDEMVAYKVVLDATPRRRNARAKALKT